MPDTKWEIWIDVGGTFTDCLATSPAGEVSRHKLLSSGITKGTIGPESERNCLVDAARRHDPAHFWVGYRCRLLGDAGQTVATTEVNGFDNAEGSLQLQQLIRQKKRLTTSWRVIWKPRCSGFATCWV